MPETKSPTQTPTDGALDLGEIEPGIAAGFPRPADGAHPWSPSEFDHRANAELEMAKLEHDRLVRLENAARSVADTLGEMRRAAGRKLVRLSGA